MTVRARPLIAKVKVPDALAVMPQPAEVLAAGLPFDEDDAPGAPVVLGVPDELPQAARTNAAASTTADADRQPWSRRARSGASTGVPRLPDVIDPLPRIDPDQMTVPAPGRRQTRRSRFREMGSPALTESVN